MSAKTLKEAFPIHWLVWHNDYEELDRILSDEEHDKEIQDPRGRTPLHLAVALGHLESTRVLLRRRANANAENKSNWTVMQEAVATGDPEIVQLCLKYRDHQRYTQRTSGVPELLEKLKEAPDFYVEMKWEFTSWVPLVSRVCPSDTYKVWKSGSNVRIDTTLLGFDNMNWQRGSRSYVFKGEADTAMVMEIDHDCRQVYSETMKVQTVQPDVSLLMPSEDAVAARLTSPIVTTYIDTDKISFERNKSGIWGWRSDKVENVNDHECKVFSASNVELVTKTRTEHLTDQDKKKTQKTSKTPLESFLGMAEQHEKQEVEGATANGDVSFTSYNPSCITPEEYFNSALSLEGKDIGRPKEQSTKTQKFKATLWLCEDYPLSLQEQVVPIIDLMAQSNAHFRKLKDFITLQLPAGFPTKIEIPLFHVLNARITFGNIFASDKEAQYVTCINDSENVSCTVDPECFENPPGYIVMGDGHHERVRDEDDEIFQFVLQQSLLDGGTETDQVTFYEALNKNKTANRPLPRTPSSLQAAEEERQLQRALEESMMLSAGVLTIPDSATTSSSNSDTNPTSTGQSPGRDDDQLLMVLEMSQREEAEAAKRRKQEEEELEMILKLSLTEK